jgi:hypothetical protein
MEASFDNTLHVASRTTNRSSSYLGRHISRAISNGQYIGRPAEDLYMRMYILFQKGSYQETSTSVSTTVCWTFEATIQAKKLVFRSFAVQQG